MQSHRVEFLSTKGFGLQEGEFRYVALALDGQLVEPFWVHESDWRKFTQMGELERFLTAQAQSVLEQQSELLASEM